MPSSVTQWDSKLDRLHTVGKITYNKIIGTNGVVLYQIVVGGLHWNIVIDFRNNICCIIDAMNTVLSSLNPEINLQELQKYLNIQ